MNKLLIVSLIVGVLLGSAFMYLYQIPKTPSREVVLKELSLAIEQEVEAGNYRCCIDPPCDMCYLGHWLWDDGSCKCDDMIAQGEYDKVCPQCKKGIETGLCESTDNETCPPE
ncbi:hypothetical protein KKB44_05285 [Candidatus Micrarchaeota archaeon]|nr:hypothetical protein [Candidatus Micrarchaeota archaeon]